MSEKAERIENKHTLGYLNEHLFKQMERLNADDLSSEQLKEEVNRSGAMSSIARDIISNANLILKARGPKSIGNVGNEASRLLEGSENEESDE